MRNFTEQRLLVSKEFQAAAIRTAYGLKPDFDPEDQLVPFAGSYALYKPSAAAPDTQFSIGRLTIGSGGNPADDSTHYDCSYEFNSNGDAIEGQLVPLDDRALIILARPGSDQFAQITIDHFHASTSKNEYRGLGGIWVSSMCKWQPSATPVYATRIEHDDFAFGTMGVDQIDSLTRNARERLRRGNIYSEDQLFDIIGNRAPA
jgi:hypothetical protein